jgi:hypothetical protein
LTDFAEPLIICGDVAVPRANGSFDSVDRDRRSCRWDLLLALSSLGRRSILFRSYIEAATASFAAMVVAGVAHRFWAGARVAEATAGPSGAAVKFERPVRSLVEELHARLEEINGRLVIVEDAVETLRSRERPADA